MHSRHFTGRTAIVLALSICTSLGAGQGLFCAAHAEQKDTLAAKKFSESQRLIKEKKYDAAFTALDDCLKLDPKHGPAHAQKAALHLLMEQFDKAEADCREGLKYKLPKKNLSQCHKVLAECYVQEGDYKRAEAEMDQAIALWPTAKKYYQFRYKIYRVLKKYDAAIADCTTTITLAPEFPASDLINRAEVYMVQKKYGAAVKDYTAAIKADDKRAERVYVDRAHAYQLLNMHNEAIADCTLALKHLATSKANRKHDYQALKLRADSYEKLGKKDLAADDRKKMKLIDDYEI